MTDLDSLRKTPIPEIKGIEGREVVPVTDNGENLLVLNDFAPGRIQVLPHYYITGFAPAIPEVYVREGVAHRLLRAASRLQDEHHLVVLDGWRPLELQKELFENCRKDAATANPTLSSAELDREAARYVSEPSENPAAPHLTGGAVDLTIGRGNGDLLDMGTEFDEFQGPAWTRFFEERLAAGKLTEEERQALENRRLLFHLLTREGFTNYRTEWWHFDYGNQFWGKLTGNGAFYGPTKPL